MLRIDTPAAPLGSSNTIHVSIPSDSPTCANLGLPTLPPGWHYRCVSALNLRNTNGTGWIPVDFTTMFQSSPLASLPIDPVNTVASGAFYVFVTDGRSWTLASLLESERHAPSATRDGGTDFARFEAGTNLSLWTSASGLVGYWSFDSPALGIGGIRDSALSNHGTLHNTTLAAAQVPGVVGGALRFDGVDDFIRIPHNAILNPPIFTIEAWVNPITSAGWQTVLTNHINGVRTESIELASSHFFNTITGFTRQTLSFPVVPAGRWTHLVAVYNGAQMKVYQNGTIVAGPMSATGVPWSNPGTFSIGAMESTVNPPTITEFQGLIDEVRIHNRALTEAEIRTIFNATR